MLAKLKLITKSTKLFSTINTVKTSTVSDYSYDTRDFLNKTFNYEQQLKDVIQEYLLIDKKIEGFATSDKTKFYSERNKENVHAGHFKKTYNDLTISSIGIGSYVGKPDDITDYYLYNAIKSAVLSGGINIIDTAINYRYMKSERAIGKALQVLVHKYKISREELIICSKVGFVPEDAASGRLSHSFVSDMVEKGLIDIEDVIYSDNKRPIHCIHPEFLKEQISISLDNMNISTLDVLYLHNVFESQYMIPKEVLILRVSKAFELLEKQRTEGKIKNYGLATWNSMRIDSNNNQYCSLQEMVELCEKVCGKDNGFKYLQAPINIVNPEVFIEKFQTYKIKANLIEEESSSQEKLQLVDLVNNPLKGENKKSSDNEEKLILTTLTALCNHYKINLISSSPLLQGVLLNLPLENSLFKVKHNPSKHLQLIRSIPSEALKSTLVGMKSQINIKNNLEVSKVSPLSSKEFYEVLSPKKRTPYIEKSLDI